MQRELFSSLCISQSNHLLLYEQIFFFKKANFYFRDPNSAVYILDRVILAGVWYISKVDSTQRYTNTHLLHSKIKMMSVNQISVYHTLLEAYNVMRHLSSEKIHMKWKLIERK